MMYIRHYIRKEEDIKLLITCPMCLKNMYEDFLRIEDLNKRLDKFQSDELIIKDKIKSKKEHEHICPHCNNFSIIYINELENKIRNISENKNQIEKNLYNINIGD